jgi:mono/diheme cytochrome c family protein
MAVLPLAALSLAMDTGADRRGPGAAAQAAAKPNLAKPPTLVDVERDFSTAAQAAGKRNFARTPTRADVERDFSTAAALAAGQRNLARTPTLAAVEGNFSSAASFAAAQQDLPGATATAQDSLGKAVFTGKGNCHVCHGAEAKGGPLGPDLTDAEWLHIDGKAESIADLIKKGVPAPKQFPAPMLPMGGAQLTDAEVQAVARYIVSLGAKT